MERLFWRKSPVQAISSKARMGLLVSQTDLPQFRWFKAAVEKHNYTGHIRRTGEEKLIKAKKSILLVSGLWKEY
jgi:hypothetical protein